MPSLPESVAYCRTLTRSRARNFYYSFILLPAGKRDAMCALYAFMRYCDDIAYDPDTSVNALHRWRTDMEEALSGRFPEHPLWPAFHHMVATYRIPAAYFHDMIDGVAGDLSPRCIQTFEELYKYCYQVASVVGLAVVHIFGFNDTNAPALAEKMGMAFQMTNILRDVGEDAAQGRIYLPMEDIKRFDADLQRYDDRFVALMTFEASRARQFFQDAAPLLEVVEPDSRASLRALFEIYRRLLARIERVQFRVLERRVTVPAWEKLMIVVRVSLTASAMSTTIRANDKRESLVKTDAVQTESEEIGLALVDDKIRLVAVTPDSRYRLLDPTAKLHRILYTWTREIEALQAAIDELEALINNPRVKEFELQRFFEQNQTFLTADDYKNAHPRIVLTRDDADALKPDFLLEPLDQRRLCDILDLKLPTAQIFVTKERRQRFSAAVLEACAQLREYHLYFDDPRNRETVRKRYGLFAYKPKMIVVIGRLGNVDPLALRTYELDTPQLSIRTYDDVLARIKGRYAAMKYGDRPNRTFFR